MNPIYKTFFGKHIDLSKIVSISDAEIRYVIQPNGSIHVSFQFEMQFQLMNEQIKYNRKASKNEYDCEKESLLMNDGEWQYYFEIEDKQKRSEIKGVTNLQSQINEIIQAWNNYKQSEKKPIPFSYSEKFGKCPARFQDKQGLPVCRIISDHVLRECKEESCLMVHWSKEN